MLHTCSNQQKKAQPVRAKPLVYFFIWLRGLDLYDSVLRYRPTSLLNNEWLRGEDLNL
jgi:hypothetical protein